MLSASPVRAIDRAMVEKAPFGGKMSTKQCYHDTAQVFYTLGIENGALRGKNSHSTLEQAYG